MSSNKSRLSMLNEDLIIHFPKIGSEAEGYLAVAEVGKTCSFPILRTYWVYGCPETMKRGGHAHHTMQQLLVCVSGAIEVILDNGSEKKSFLLDDPTVGLYQKPLVWGDLIYHQGSVLVVMASTLYFAEDYIRDYQEFLHLTSG
jgi:UDP-2-acetamido-3-amino-2,3-dideoxy-glucuronate N-acetyltransferase